MPLSSFSLPAAWHAMVDHGSGKRKAADTDYQVALDWLQAEIDRIAKRHKLSETSLSRHTHTARPHANCPTHRSIADSAADERLVWLSELC